MDPPQRATAAQMASRNIKNARKSKLNSRLASKDPNSVPQFATPSAEGSLFGGQFALPTESSGFNFALPNPVGFQPLSFGPAPKQVDNVEGVFQPGHYERDNRGGKRHTGWTPQSASIDGDYVNPEDRASEPKKYFGEDRLLAESKSVESSTKPLPQAPGQSFTVNWPTATENPKASPQVLGQGFAGNWPKATEQPANPSSALSFSEPQQEKPVATPEANPSMSFGSAPTQTFTALFGHTPTVSEASNMGSGASTPASPTGNPFGHTTPSNNVFGQANPSTPATSFSGQLQSVPPSRTTTSNVFGQSQPAPSHNIFGHLGTSNSVPEQPQVASPNSNIFGHVQNAPPATNMFGQVQPAPPTPTPIFGQSQPAPTHNLFGHPTPSTNAPEQQQPTPSSNGFGQSALPTSMAGSQQNTSTSNIFGNSQLDDPSHNNVSFNQPQLSVFELMSQFWHAIHSACISVEAAYSDYCYLIHTNMISAESAFDIFWPLVTDEYSAQREFCKIWQLTQIEFHRNFNQSPFKSTTATQDTSNSYGGNNTTNAVSHTTGKNMFNRAQQARDTFGMAQSSNLSTPSSLAPLNPNTQQPNILSNGISGNQQSSNLFNSPSVQQPAMHEHNNSGNQHSNPFNPSNAPSLNLVSPKPVIPSTNDSGSEQFPNLPSQSNQASLDVKPPVSTTSTSSVLASQEDPNPMPDVDSIPSLSEEAIAVHMPAGLNEDEKMKFCAAFRLHTLNQAAALILSQMPATKDFTPVWNYLCQQRRKILYHVVVNSKNLPPTANSAYSPEAPLATPAPLASAASVLATAISPVPLPSTPPRGSIFSAEASQMKRKRTFDNEDQENQNPSKRTRSSELPTYEPPSNTGCINSEQTIAPTPSLSKGKRRAEDELDQKTQQLSPLKQNLNVPTQSNLITSQSNTSNILRSIVDTPRKTNPIKSSTITQASQPGINPFGGLPVPSSSKGEFASPRNPSAAFAVNSAPTDLFAPKSASTTTLSNTFSPKPAADAVSANPFSLKPASSSTNNYGTGQKSIKSPVFGTGPVDFMAQFGQKASADEKDSEAKLMEKDKAEDMDSDEDEEEWEAKWKANRREELKKLREMSKTKKAKFVEGKGFVYDNSEASDSSDSTTSTNSKVTGQVTNGLFNSPNPSLPSTPGLRSSTGSVLGGNSGPVEKEHNIFGNLSSSNKGSGSDDPEDYASGGENDLQEDSENIDPKQNHETDSDSNVPETKAVFGLAKNRVLQDTDKTPTGSNSIKDTETSETPKRSLFDRMNKDADGKPIRSLQTEEKENTQPTSSTIFGGTNNPFASSVNKVTSSENTQVNGGTVFGEVKNPFGSSLNSPTPTDQTWKPYSPIKFGSATTTAESAPTFSVTAATPPKSQSPSIFGSLKPQAQFTGFSSSSNNAQPVSSTAPPTFSFGSANQSKLNSTTPSNLFSTPASSNLFGSTGSSSNLFGATTPKQPAVGSVGFGFGGSSATSSLFPSAAGSADTSRATSPGGTTDNDSGVENDADTEKHEQINLTNGGPGEENEEIIFEVRAKLMKFDPKDKDKQWPVQGIGPLRLLKHKETGVTRVVMRSDPSGKLLLNKGILPTVSYEANGKTMKLMAASDNGKGLETYLVQVKEPEMAKKLAEELNANKNQ